MWETTRAVHVKRKTSIIGAYKPAGGPSGRLTLARVNSNTLAARLRYL